MTQSIYFDSILNNIPNIDMGARSANAPLTQSYDQGPDVPLIEATIGDFFDAIVAKYPEREALVSSHQNIRLTYRELQQQVNQLASAMIEMGLEIGDRLGIWSHNNAEWLLLQLATAKIRDVQVVGVPDKRYGEVLAAWIIPKKPNSLTEDEVKQFCREHIAHYKVPTYYRFVTEYPMTVTGKIQKYKIVELMKEELGLE